MENKSLFICSSFAELDVAYGLQENLANDFDVEIWKQGSFGLSEHFFESLIKASKKFNYVLIILTPDENQSLRDNIIFEMGFFYGVFGRNRTFFVVEKSLNLKLPSYIDGISCAIFSKPTNGATSLTAALGPSCYQIKKAIRDSPDFNAEAKALIESFVTSALSIACQAISTPFTAEEAKLRVFIFKKENTKLVCTNFWAPHDVSESIGTTFEINAETERQVAVVRSAKSRIPVGVSISVLPDNIDGVSGNIDKNLCFILAAPIFSPGGEVWGTVDFDASDWRGENILRRQTTEKLLLQLGKHLYKIFTRIN
jgi:hypothetical protein